MNFTNEQIIGFRTFEKNEGRDKHVDNVVTYIIKNDYVVDERTKRVVSILAAEIEKNPFYSRDLLGLDRILTYLSAIEVVRGEKIKSLLSMDTHNNPFWNYLCVMVMDSLINEKRWVDPMAPNNAAIDVFFLVNKLSPMFIMRINNLFLECIRKNNEVASEKDPPYAMACFLISKNDEFQYMYNALMRFPEIQKRVQDDAYMGAMRTLVEFTNGHRVLPVWKFGTEALQEFSSEKKGLLFGVVIQIILWMKPALDMTLQSNITSNS